MHRFNGHINAPFQWAHQCTVSMGTSMPPFQWAHQCTVKSLTLRTGRMKHFQSMLGKLVINIKSSKHCFQTLRQN